MTRFDTLPGTNTYTLEWRSPATVTIHAENTELVVMGQNTDSAGMEFPSIFRVGTQDVALPALATEISGTRGNLYFPNSDPTTQGAVGVIAGYELENTSPLIGDDITTSIYTGHSVDGTIFTQTSVDQSRQLFQNEHSLGWIVGVHQQVTDPPNYYAAFHVLDAGPSGVERKSNLFAFSSCGDPATIPTVTPTSSQASRAQNPCRLIVIA